MHIVLQAGSNVVLKRMNRKYTKQIFLQTVEEKMKRLQPDFTCDYRYHRWISRRNGGTIFKRLSTSYREVQFAKVHMFPYSDRGSGRARPSIRIKCLPPLSMSVNRRCSELPETGCPFAAKRFCGAPDGSSHRRARKGAYIELFTRARSQHLLQSAGDGRYDGK